jgi:flagellar biosynthesis/type III secretory pathway M-ring protein FliF/YscJ
MDALKQQLLKIQQQLAGLSASQKMLTASLVVIMIMTLFYWARFAGSSEMAVLIDSPMTAEDLGTIKNALAGRNIKYEVQGDRILVPEDKRFEIIADLGYAQALPRNEASGFDSIISKLTPFDPQSKTDRYMDHARELTLSRLISAWPGVKSATVLLYTDRKLSPVRPIEPSATVDIRLKPGVAADRRKLADSAVNFVTGSQGGLNRDKVTITIDGLSQKPGGEENLMGGSDTPYLEAKANNENYYIQKIQKAVQNVPGIYATVSVDLNVKNTTTQEHKLDKSKIEVMLENSSKSSENTQTTAGGEPGAAPNTGVTMEQSTPSGGGQNSTTEETKNRFMGDYGRTDTQVVERAGAAPAVGAALRIPDTYFVAAWKKRAGNAGKEPTEADIEALVQRETPKFRKLVQAATNIKDADAITVETYIDLSEAPTPAEVATAGLAALPMGFGFGAKEVAIAVLAVVSLFMVSMMVRKSVPQVPAQLALAGVGGGTTPMTIGEAAGEEPNNGMSSFGADLVGEVGEVGLMLTGQEMSEGEIESKQMIEQVGTMVKENPDAAANLVKRWLNRD